MDARLRDGPLGQAPQAQQVIDLLIEISQSARVDQYMIRTTGLLRQGQLSPLTGQQFFRRPAASRGHTPPPFLLRSIDENQAIANSLPTCFEHDRSVKHDEANRRVFLGASYFLFDAATDPGMHEAFEIMPLLFVAEDDTSPRRRRLTEPSGFSTTAGQRRAMASITSPAAARPLVAQIVGGDDIGSAPGKGGGDDALAAADAAHQT